jgi:hypothetical protein
MEKDATLRLNNIFFAQAEAVLMPESYPELDELAEVMKKNPKMRIQLEGHTEIYGNKKALKKTFFGTHFGYQRVSCQERNFQKSYSVHWLWCRTPPLYRRYRTSSPPQQKSRAQNFVTENKQAATSFAPK